MMIIYATYDSRYCLSEKLFPPLGAIPQNQERFRVYTAGSGFIVSEAIFESHLKNKPIEGHQLILVSESLYQKLEVPAPVILGTHPKKYVEHDGYWVCINYQDAVSLARRSFHNTTILGDGPLLKQAITSFNVDLVVTVSVPTRLPGSILFPAPLHTTYFDEVTPVEPWETEYGTALLQIFYRKSR